VHDSQPLSQLQGNWEHVTQSLSSVSWLLFVKPSCMPSLAKSLRLTEYH
jgi:hypothetical protein